MGCVSASSSSPASSLLLPVAVIVGYCLFRDYTTFYTTPPCYANYHLPSKHVHIGPISAACRNIAVGIPTSDRRRSDIDNYTDIGPISAACRKIAVGIPTSDRYRTDIQFADCFHSRVYYTHTGYIRGIEIWLPKHIKICS